MTKRLRWRHMRRLLSGLRVIMPRRELSQERKAKGQRMNGIADYYLTYSLANKNFLKVAELAASIKDYYKAIEYFERVGKSSIDNHLTKWSVKDYFMKAAMCHLATTVSSPPPNYMPQGASPAPDLANLLSCIGSRCYQTCSTKLRRFG